MAIHRGPRGHHQAAHHQREAAPLHNRMVAIYGALCLACIAGGVIAIIWNAVAKTEFSLFGIQMTTGHVGEAFVGIGVAFVGIGMFILKNQYDLAALPPRAKKPKNDPPK